MRYREVISLIENGENLTTEFKQRFSSHEKIAKEIIAFANTSGGYLIMGIDDDTSVYGVESEKGEAELIKECAEKYCEPPVNYNIEYFDIYGKEILVVRIFESNVKPHRIQDYENELNLNTAQVYVRVNDKSILAGKEMIKVLQTQTNEKTLENYVISKNEKIVFNYLDKHETITVKELGKAANISGRRASRTLINLVRANLLLIHTNDRGEDYFTYAG